MFEMNDDTDNHQQLPSKCHFLEINHNGKRMFIHKTTAIWLFQEGERVSADRLFQVQEIQPYTHLIPKLFLQMIQKIPIQV